MQKSNIRQYPPYDYLKIILQQCPRSALTYLDLWSQRDANSQVVVHMDKIEDEYLNTRTKFKNDLLAIHRCGLANYLKSPSKFDIELVDFDEDFEGELAS